MVCNVGRWCVFFIPLTAHSVCVSPEAAIPAAHHHTTEQIAFCLVRAKTEPRAVDLMVLAHVQPDIR